MKYYMQPGEYCYFRSTKVRCKEVTSEMGTREEWCNHCCLKDSFICFWVRCREKERPDKKNVIFVHPKTREKK